MDKRVTIKKLKIIQKLLEKRLSLEKPTIRLDKKSSPKIEEKKNKLIIIIILMIIRKNGRKDPCFKIGLLGVMTIYMLFASCVTVN